MVVEFSTEGLKNIEFFLVNFLFGKRVKKSLTLQVNFKKFEAGSKSDFSYEIKL